MKRVLTALLLIPLIWALNFLAPTRVVSLALVVVGLLALRELFSLTESFDLRPFRVAGQGVGVLIILVPRLPEPAFLVGVTALLLLLSLRWNHPLGDSLGSTASTLFGVIYICGPFALAHELHKVNPHWLFLVLLMNWVGDSAAYYFGRWLGRHKLARRISPNKTWEGTIASLALAVPVGTAYVEYFRLTELGLWAALALAVWVNVAAQFGDLAESTLKRGAGVKDSGQLLPGHGGMLDRIDGLLFSLPACYFWVISVG